MDESWRMRMGMPSIHRRRSMEDTLSDRTRRSIFSGGSESETLDPDDFSDVFGGPPRSLLAHKFSKSTSFYDEIFRPPEFIAPANKTGRCLPEFRIPATNHGFYCDIFGSDDERMSRERSGVNSKAKSASNSSSVLSSEELSPLRQVIGNDVALSAFASKLRPINVPCKWNSSTKVSGEHPKKQAKPAFACNRPSFESEYQENELKDNFRSSYFGFSRRVSSPEITSIEPSSCRSFKASVYDWEVNSPSSAVFSSICLERESKSAIQENELVSACEEDETMGSFVIEVTSNLREEGREAVSIEEAIAWAKEKFQTHSSEKDTNMMPSDNEQSSVMEDRTHLSENEEQVIDDHGNAESPEVDQGNQTVEEKQKSEKDASI